MYVNIVSNKFSSPSYLNVDVLLTRRHGHIYLEWVKNECILFTEKELLKINRSFSHPATDNLFNLLKLAQLWETDDRTKNY